MRYHNSVLFSLALPFAFSVSSCSNKTKFPHNVLIILADDLGYADLQCYGSSFYETPNLDRLAKEGVKFTNGYATCPVCSPSRSSIQTGKNPVKTGITDWIPGRAAFSKPSVRDRWISAPLKNELNLDETTLAEAFKTNGYVTFFAGKWHLGEEEKYWPENQGYDINLGGWSKGSPNKSKNSNGYFSPYGNPRLTDGPEGEYLPERLTSEAIKFIKEKRNKPFMMFMSYYLVHTPLMAKEEMIARFNAKRESLSFDSDEEFSKDLEWMKFDSKEKNGYAVRNIQAHPVYASMVASLDENVGRILTALKESRLDENTIVIFTSDNGGLSTSEGSPTSNSPLRAGKGWLYEGGIRVPYIIKAPGINAAQNAISDCPVTGADIFPTLVSLTGISVDKSQMEGIDISPVLRGETFPERPLFWHYPHYSNQGGNPGSVVRMGKYKLIHDFETGKKELYNLDIDISESNDISAENHLLVDSLFQILVNWRTENGALMMTENPDWNRLDPIVE